MAHFLRTTTLLGLLALSSTILSAAAQRKNKKQFVYRFDDVQVGWQEDVQIDVIDWCMKRENMAISLGVIGPNFGGDGSAQRYCHLCVGHLSLGRKWNASPCCSTSGGVVKTN